MIVTIVILGLFGLWCLGSYMYAMYEKCVTDAIIDDWRKERMKNGLSYLDPETYGRHWR